MKQKRECQYCKTEYSTSSSRSKYCSTKCRVFAYRKRNNLPDPFYLIEHKSPKRTEIREVEQRVKEITPAYKTLLDKEKEIFSMIELLQERKADQIRKFNKKKEGTDELFLTNLNDPINGEQNNAEKRHLKRIENLSAEIARAEIYLEKVHRLMRTCEKYTYTIKTIRKEVKIPIVESEPKETAELPASNESVIRKRPVPVNVNSYKTITRKNKQNIRYKAFNFTEQLQEKLGKPPLNFSCTIKLISGVNYSVLIDMLSFLADEYVNVSFYTEDNSIINMFNSESDSDFISLNRATFQDAIKFADRSDSGVMVFLYGNISEDMIQNTRQILQNKAIFYISENVQTKSEEFIQLSLESKLNVIQNPFKL